MGKMGKTTRRQLKPAPERPDLDELLRKAAKHVMTPAEIREQRRSWVRGELMLEHPEMTREEADRLIDEGEKADGL